MPIIGTAADDEQREGAARFGAAVLAARLALGRWHESELRAPD